MATVTDKYQVGNSLTPSQNFVIKTGNDGTFTIARGILTAEIGDVFKIAADGSLTVNGVPVAKYYEMTVSGWTAGGDILVTHNLGVIPKFVTYEAVAKIALDKLAVGETEEIYQWTNSTTTYGCCARKKTTTQLTVGVGAAGVSTANTSNIQATRTNTQVDIKIKVYG